MMTGMFRLILILFSILSLTQAAIAEEKEEKDYSNEPWEKAALYLGAFMIDINSDDFGYRILNINLSDSIKPGIYEIIVTAI